MKTVHTAPQSTAHRMIPAAITMAAAALFITTLPACKPTQAGPSAKATPSPSPATQSYTPLPSPSPTSTAAQAAAESAFLEARKLDRGDGVPQDQAKAREGYLKAADLGSTKAMLNLGVLYVKGQGGDTNNAEGYRWIRKAADSGDPRALYSCALLTISGTGVTADHAEAKKLIEKSAEAGFTLALVNLAQSELTGTDVIAKDTNLAVIHLTKAAGLGDAEAARTLYGLYSKGEVVPPDPQQTARWLHRAAELGDPWAQFEFAHPMMNGSPEKAYPWVKLAYESKYMAVLPLYNECIAVLTPEQLKAGDEEAARIKAGYPKTSQ
jgi:TPR repeat protein